MEENVMKKIFLALAAVAALASCVKENTLVPEQTADNLVTITAVSADTKTTLGNDGTSVVWQKDDAIKVVFKSPSKQYVTEFTTDIDGTATTAAFSGLLDAEVTTDACGDAGYAVYPSTVNVESDGKILFTVSETQNGLIEKGENLAYAEVLLNEIRNTHTTEATFANVLSLLKITVPQGVKKITVTSTDEDEDGVATPIAGNAPYFYTDGTLVINEEKWYDSDRVYSVVLQNQDNSDLDHTKSHYVHVFPGECEGLTITVDGTDCSYSKKVGAFTFVASKYHTLNIANIFNLASDTYAASPFGGIVEIPVITTVDEYEVTIPAEATWLTKTPSAKGAFHKDIVSFTAAANTTGAERAATVTINGVEVVISQKGYVPELLNEYVETYSQYGQPFTGTLTIEATDNASFGVYKVKICGSTLYADYSGGKLVLHDGKYDRELVVSADYKTISAATLALGYTSYSDYKAVLPLGPAELTPEEEALVGEYDESWTFNGTPVTSPAGLKISASDEASFGKFKVVFLTVNGSGAECYANLSVDGTKLQLDCYGASHLTYFSIAQPIDMSINSDGSLSFASAYNQQYKEISNYKATRVADSGDGDDEDDEGKSTGVANAASLHGTYSEKFNDFSGSHEGTMTISVEGENITVRMLAYGSGYSTYYLECPATLSLDGKTLTVESNGVTYQGSGMAFTENIILNINAQDDSITLSTDKSFALSAWGSTYYLNTYTATKQ